MAPPPDFKRDIERHNFKINDLIVVPSRDLLLKSGDEYTLEPLVMDLLCVLAENPGEVMMREKLIDRLWALNNGGDENLTRAVSVLRKTLRKTGAPDDCIETIPKRGYRLTRPVSSLNPRELETNFVSKDRPPPNRYGLSPTFVIICLLAIPIFIFAAMRL